MLAAFYLCFSVLHSSKLQPILARLVMFKIHMQRAAMLILPSFDNIYHFDSASYSPDIFNIRLGSPF